MNSILQAILALIVEVYTTGKGSITIPTDTIALNTTVGVGGTNYTVAASVQVGGTVTVTKA